MRKRDMRDRPGSECHARTRKRDMRDTGFWVMHIGSEVGCFKSLPTTPVTIGRCKDVEKSVQFLQGAHSP